LCNQEGRDRNQETGSSLPSEENIMSENEDMIMVGTYQWAMDEEKLSR
jgi:hypothetical protein